MALLSIADYDSVSILISISGLQDDIAVEEHEANGFGDFVLLIFVCSKATLTLHLFIGVAVGIDFVDEPFRKSHQQFVLLQVILVLILWIVGIYLDVLLLQKLLDFLFLFS